MTDNFLNSRLNLSLATVATFIPLISPGLTDEGIYRLSGNCLTVAEIKAKYDNGKVSFMERKGFMEQVIKCIYILY